MSSETPKEKKASQTIAERVAKYKAKNPNEMKLHRLKETTKKVERRLNDEKFDEEVKKKNRERKRKERAAKKAENIVMMDNPTSEVPSFPTPSLSSSSPSSPSSSRTGDKLVVKFPFTRAKSTKRKPLQDDTPMDISEDGILSTNTSPDSSSTSPPWIDDSSSSPGFGNSSSFSNSPMFSSTPSSSRDGTKISRQAELGKMIRKKNNKIKLNEIDELKAALAKSKEENVAKDIKISEQTSDIRKLRSENNDLKDKLNHADDWLKPTYMNMSPSGKTELKTAVNMAKNDFPMGTMSRLRTNTGINFSNPPIASDCEDSPLKKAIGTFAFENSCEVPDIKAAKKGLRYFYCYKYVLWIQFKSAQVSEVSYSQFCRYWPKNIIKPKIEDFGTCKCQICENAELLVSAMKRNGYLTRNHELEIMIKDVRDGDDTSEIAFKEELNTLQSGDKKDNPVSFLQWEKVNKSGKNGNKRDVINRIQKTTTCKDAAKMLVEKFDNLKKHLDRNFTIKKTIREKREMVMDSVDKAYIHMDWAENLEIQIPGEVQSAYFAHTSISIHTGYLYSKKDSGGFASLSDENNHKAEAIHAGLKPTVEKLVQNGIKHIVCVSDSTTSQYRNNKNVWLTKELAVKHQITIEWIYTEAGHGKSCCDGVGGTIKNIIRDFTAFNTSTVITGAADVLVLIADHTTIDLTTHTKEDIETVVENLPGLSSLKGALKIHQINFDPEGNIKAKNLPTDPTFNVVNLKTLRSKPAKRNLGEAPAEDTANEDNDGDTED